MSGPLVRMFMISESQQVATLHSHIHAYVTIMTVVFLALFGCRDGMLTPKMWGNAVILTPIYVVATGLVSRYFRQASEQFIVGWYSFF
ncbi:hypothetical protein C2W62_40635 [Candidatus Entotheonella serta]|nr:hypothetical protein C2W62_40635 [Candidatus Entotheonella serta]